MDLFPSTSQIAALHGMEANSVSQQEDVDRAFADYDSLVVCPHPSYASRTATACLCCGNAHFTYNSTGSNEPGACICNKCGTVQPGNIIFEQMFGRCLPTRTSNYKRIHHWHERISQLMLMESKIPAHHMLAIGEKLLDGSTTIVCKDTIRSVLRSLGLQVYIEKWLQIIERCTGVMPPCPGPIILNRLDELFLELQRPFAAHKINERRNFLNYNYVFCRLFQRMGCVKFCMFFPLIRSKVKLKTLDDMWAAMASSLGWDCPPLQFVAPFSVRIDQPSSLLKQLRSRCAAADVAVPRTIPMKTASRKLDHYHSTVRQPEKQERRLEQSVPKLQTLSLRLKLRRNKQA